MALFGLIGHRMHPRGTSRPGRSASAVTAVGKRSLSCYLVQSVICAPLLAAWGLGLGGTFGSAAVALFAVGVWLLTVVLAYLQERAGQRGPAEVLLRRLVYPRGGADRQHQVGAGRNRQSGPQQVQGHQPDRQPELVLGDADPGLEHLDGQQQHCRPAAQQDQATDGAGDGREHRGGVQVGQQHSVQTVAGHPAVAGVRAAAGQHRADRPRSARAGPA